MSNVSKADWFAFLYSQVRSCRGDEAYSNNPSRFVSIVNPLGKIIG
jgi:hypothetical protein